MPAGASARRYAQAAFEIAVERGDTERWLDDLTQLADSAANADLRRTLAAPRIPFARKDAIIRESLGQTVAPLALNLMLLLTSRNLVHLLPSIADRFQELLDAHNGVSRAEAVSAVPLDDGQREKVERALADMYGGEVRLTSRVDPEILGGMVIRIGDRVLDGSARTRLQNMRRELAQRR